MRSWELFFWEWLRCLTNGTLPAGEIQKVDAQEIVYGYKTIEFTENVRFDIYISPFASGTNTITVKVSDTEGNRSL